MERIAGFDAAVMADVERETSELLSQLIRIDTSNPPGDETRVAEFLAGWFAAAGLDGEIVGEPAGRRSFVLRLQGRRPGKSLLLLAHEDVVPANAGDWQVPPFAGVIKDGYVWGRGAVDIKNLVAAHAVAVRRLAAAGAPLLRHRRLRRHRRRGGGHGGRRPLARRAPPRPDALRLRPQRGRRLVHPAERPQGLPAGDRREGHRRSSASWCAARRATPRCRCAAATPWSARRASWRRSPRTSCPS